MERFESYEWLAAVISAHKANTVRGSTRLQKTIRLLQSLNLESDYWYDMHFYGPYSAALQADVGLLGAVRLATPTETQSEHGFRRTDITVEPNPRLPKLPVAIAAAIDRMERESDATVLELAATYLAFHEEEEDEARAMERLRVKKAKKITPERMSAAAALLKDLKLPTFTS